MAFYWGFISLCRLLFRQWARAEMLSFPLAQIPLVMTEGEDAMRREFERLAPLMKTGGFIPSVDHQTHPGVSLEQYRVYRCLLEKYTIL